MATASGKRRYEEEYEDDDVDASDEEVAALGADEDGGDDGSDGSEEAGTEDGGDGDEDDEQQQGERRPSKRPAVVDLDPKDASQFAATLAPDMGPGTAVLQLQVLAAVTPWRRPLPTLHTPRARYTIPLAAS